MWSAVYRLATGELVSTGTSVADPLPDGLAVTALGDSLPSGDWDCIALAFVSAPIDLKVISKIDFMRRFTVEEEAKIRTLARTDAMAEVFLSRLAAVDVVHLDNQETSQGVGYCALKGVIEEYRIAEILG